MLIFETVLIQRFSCFRASSLSKILRHAYFQKGAYYRASTVFATLLSCHFFLFAWERQTLKQNPDKRSKENIDSSDFMKVIRFAFQAWKILTAKPNLLFRRYCSHMQTFDIFLDISWTLFNLSTKKIYESVHVKSTRSF